MSSHQSHRASRGLLLTTLIGVAFAGGLAAQTPQQRLLVVNYRKVAPGKAADQRKFAEGAWKKFYQALVDDNRYHGAMTMRLTQPYATGASADWAIVVFPVQRPTLAPLDQAVGEAAARKAGFASLQAYQDMSNASSTAVRQEWLNTTMRIGSVQAGNYMRGVRYLVPLEHRAAFNEWMRDVAMPLNANTIKAGKGTGWGVSIVPGVIGTPDEAGYSHSVTFLVKDANGFDAGPNPVTEARMKEVFGDKMTMANYYNRQNQIFSHVKTVSTKIWEVVSVAGKVPTINP